MFSIKSEPSDRVGVGSESQRIRLIGDNPHINDIGKSDNPPDDGLQLASFLCCGYVKTEPSTSASHNNTSNSEGNGGIHSQNSIDTNLIKTEEKEECTNITSRHMSGEGTNITSRHMSGEELNTMYLKEKSQLYLIEDHGYQLYDIFITIG